MMYDFHSCSSSFLAQSIIHLRKYLVDRRPLIRQHLREPAKLRERSLRYIRRWSSERGESPLKMLVLWSEKHTFTSCELKHKEKLTHTKCVAQ